MFKLAQSDKKKFEALQTLDGAVAKHQLTGDEYSLAVKGHQLESHIAAHSFAGELLGSKIDLSDENHQKILGLGLAVQQSPETWNQYNVEERQTILKLLAIKNDAVNRCQATLLSKIENEVFSLETLGDACSFLPGGSYLVKSLKTGIGRLKGRLAGGASFERGVGLEIVENLDLDSGEILASGIQLNTEALQFVSTKQQISIDHVKEVLQAYHIRFEDLSPDDGEKIRKQYSGFQQKDRETLRGMKATLDEIKAERDSERKLQMEKEQYFQRLNNAKEFFRGAQAIGSLIKDRKLSQGIQMMGMLGEQGMNISHQVTLMRGLVPGVAAPTGLDMLFPMANIAFAIGSVLVSILTKKKSSGESPMKAIMEALQTISKQISELRKEMHERFDMIDEKLLKIAENMFNSFELMKSIIHFESSSVKEIMRISVERLQQDIEELTRITESGHRELALIHYQDQVVAPITCYLDGTSDHALESIKVAILEKNWLLGQFCSGLFAGKYFRADQPYHQIARIAEKRVELILGYLAQFAKEKLGILGVREIDLPSIDPFMEGIGLSLAARTHLKLKDNKDVPLVNLRDIQRKIIDSIETIKILREDAPKLYESLFKIYLQELDEIEKKIIEILSQKTMAAVATDTVPLPSIKLSKLLPTQADLPELNASHFMNCLSHVTVPRILLLAEELGLGQFEASYAGAKTSGSAGHGPGGGWNYPYTRTPAMPIYYINLKFKLKCSREHEVEIKERAEIEIEIPILNVSFKRTLEPETGRVVGKGACHYDANVTCPQYVNAQNSITLPSIIGSHWMSSSVVGKPSICDYQPAVKEQVKMIITEAWKKAKEHNPNEERKLSGEQYGEQYGEQNGEQKVFMEAVNGLKNDAGLFTNMMDKLNAVRALFKAYSKLMGLDLDRELREEFSRKLKGDLNLFLQSPILFKDVRKNISDFLRDVSMGPDFRHSRVLVKLAHAGNIISLYDKHLRNGVIPKDKIPEQSMHARFIDWSNIEIEKDDKGVEVSLGKGGFGTVYRARWNTENGAKIVAIKVINADLGEAENKTFKEEIEKVSKLYSPHIVRSFGYSKKDGRLCLVMELAKKGSLDKYLTSKENKISEERQVLWIMQLARGLQTLHSQGIIHGDIKSLNVLLDEEGHAKLNDFGLSCTTKNAKKTTITSSLRRPFGRTKTGLKSTLKSMHAFCGSLLWQPPEAITFDMDRLKPQSFAGDVYSLGVVIWEIFSQKLPFESLLNEHDAEMRVRMAVLGNLEKSGKKLQRYDIDMIPEFVPVSIKEMIVSCWQMDPAKRPSMNDIVTKLNQAFPGLAIRMDQMAADFEKGSVRHESKEDKETKEAMDFEGQLKEYRRFSRKG